MKEMLKNRDTDIYFWGKALDDKNEPVDGVKVTAHIIKFSPDGEKLFGETKSIKRITGIDGSFSVEKEKGRSLYIDNISKDNYEDMTLKSSRNFQYFKHGNDKQFIADRASPIIFRLRKQGETVFCLESKYLNCQTSTNESGKIKGFDFIREEAVRDIADLMLNGEPLTCDIKVKAILNINSATWTVTLSPGDTNGGIIVSEQLLHEAPETGYQSEHTFTPQDQKPPKAKYIYLKSRDPAIYTRYEIEYINANKEFFRLSGKSVTNPYGDRNLEQATNLPWAVTKQLTDEVETAFRQGKRPSKPDLQKLIKDASNK